MSEIYDFSNYCLYVEDGSCLYGKNCMNTECEYPSPSSYRKNVFNTNIINKKLKHDIEVINKQRNKPKSRTNLNSRDN